MDLRPVLESFRREQSIARAFEGCIPLANKIKKSCFCDHRKKHPRHDGCSKNRLRPFLDFFCRQSCSQDQDEQLPPQKYFVKRPHSIFRTPIAGASASPHPNRGASFFWESGYIFLTLRPVLGCFQREQSIERAYGEVARCGLCFLHCTQSHRPSAVSRTTEESAAPREAPSPDLRSPTRHPKHKAT